MLTRPAAGTWPWDDFEPDPFSLAKGPPTMKAFSIPSPRTTMAVLAAMLAVGLLDTSTPARAALVITPTYAANITGDPNAATIIGTINSAIQEYQNFFSDNI